MSAIHISIRFRLTFNEVNVNILEQNFAEHLAGTAGEKPVAENMLFLTLQTHVPW